MEDLLYEAESVRRYMLAEPKGFCGSPCTGGGRPLERGTQQACGLPKRVPYYTWSTELSHEIGRLKVESGFSDERSYLL
jgi:hypothetical protein